MASRKLPILKVYGCRYKSIGNKGLKEYSGRERRQQEQRSSARHQQGGIDHSPLHGLGRHHANGLLNGIL